jgi:hypothetical protein
MSSVFSSRDLSDDNLDVPFDCRYLRYRMKLWSYVRP